MVAGVGAAAAAALVIAAAAARPVVTTLMSEVVNGMDVALMAGRECYNGWKIVVPVVPGPVHVTVKTRVAPTVPMMGM